MTFLNYLDDEYFQLQDYLSTLIDTLPVIHPKSNLDDKAFVKTIIHQNKAYARKVASLYQKVNSFYTNTLNLSDKQQQRSSNDDFVTKLQEKLQEYEGQIQQLRSENKAYSKQLKHFSHQIDSSRTKDLIVNPFFSQNQGHHHRVFSKDINPQTIVTKSMNDSFNIPSPIPRPSNVSRISKDASFDLEHMFMNAEYKKAMELLSQLDYQAPQNIPLEKFSKWLVIANKTKDSQMNEIYMKLRSVIAPGSEFVQQHGDLDEWEEHGKEMDDSLDRQQYSVVDRIWLLLEDKLPNRLRQGESNRRMKSKSPQRTTNTPRDEAVEVQTAYFKEKDESEKEERYMNEGQLRQKVRYLKESLQKSEVESKGREAEVMLLRDKIREAIGKGDLGHLRKRSGDLSDREGRDRTRQELETYKSKYESLKREVDMYKSRLGSLETEEEGEERFKGSLIRSNKDAKRSRTPQMNRLDEGTLSYSQELLSKSYTGKYTPSRSRDDVGLDATDFRNKERQRTPTVSQIDPATGSPGGERRDMKENLLLENGLQGQKNSLYTTRQLVGEFKALILENLRITNIEPYIGSPSYNNESNVGYGEFASEAQKTLRTNTNTIVNVNNDLRGLKRDTFALISKLQSTNKRQVPVSNLDTELLREKISSAEEGLMENISNTLQTLSRLTTALYEINSSESDSHTSHRMNTVLDLIQVMHAQLEKTIQEYPEISESLAAMEGGKHGQRGEFQSWKKKFAFDRQELTEKLRATLQKFESGLANDAMRRLSDEIEKNQHLQEIIETKKMLVHRLNIICNSGIDRAENSLRQLYELADSEDAQKILSSIINELVLFRKNYSEALISQKSPLKRMRDNRDEESQLIKEHTRIQSGLTTIIRGSQDFTAGLERRRTTSIDKRRERREGSDAAVDLIRGISEREREERERESQKLRERIRDLEVEREELVNHIKRLEDGLEQSRRENEGLRDAVERTEEEMRRVTRDASHDIEVREKDIEMIRKQLGELERENRELLEYKATTEAALKKASQQVGSMKLGYFSDVNILKEENNRLEAKRQELLGELDRKTEENNKLNQLIDTLQKFSNKQMETLREKEERLALITNQKRESEALVRDLERQMEALTSKNKRSIEKAKESVEDVNAVRNELKRAVDRNSEMQKDAESLRLWTKELTEERDQLRRDKEMFENERVYVEDKLKKMSEIVEITKAELRKTHEMLEQRNEENAHMEKELLKIREHHFQRDDYKEPEYVAIIKRELKVRNEELQKTKTDNRRLIEVNEKLQTEFDSYKALSRGLLPSSRQSTADFDKDLSRRLIKTENVGSEAKESQFTGKDSKNSSILKSRTGSPIQIPRIREEAILNENIERGVYSDRFEQEKPPLEKKRWERSENKGQSEGYGGILGNKEKEINRLTQVVKDLTQSLRSSQDALNSQVRQRMQFSSPQ